MRSQTRPTMPSKTRSSPMQRKIRSSLPTKSQKTQEEQLQVPRGIRQSQRGRSHDEEDKIPGSAQTWTASPDGLEDAITCPGKAAGCAERLGAHLQADMASKELHKRCRSQSDRQECQAWTKGPQRRGRTPSKSSSAPDLGAAVRFLQKVGRTAAAIAAL